MLLPLSLCPSLSLCLSFSLSTFSCSHCCGGRRSKTAAQAAASSRLCGAVSLTSGIFLCYTPYTHPHKILMMICYFSLASLSFSQSNIPKLIQLANHAQIGETHSYSYSHSHDSHSHLKRKQSEWISLLISLLPNATAACCDQLSSG